MGSKPCRTCRAPVLLVRKAENTTSWIPVEAAQVPPGAVRDESTVRVLRPARTGYANVHAYGVDHLRRTLDGASRLSFESARGDTVYEFPWHVVHRCESGGR